MSDVRTGRTRLRAARDYGSDVLVLQVEVLTSRDETAGPFWRDAKVDDVTVTGGLPAVLPDRLPSGASVDRLPRGVTYLPD